MNITFVTIHAYRTPQAVPLAAASIAANLPLELQRKTQFINLYLEGQQGDNVGAILATEPDVVSISLYLWNRQAGLLLIDSLRKRRPELTIIVGGPEVTANPQKIGERAPGVICIPGEGEESFRRYIELLQTGSSDGDSLIGGEDCSVAADLDTLPSPWLSGLLPLEHGGGVLWEVTRGCHYSCDYCFDGRGSSGVRTFPTDRLRRELELFKERQVGHIWLLDSSFNADPEHAVKLLELIAQHGGPALYHFEGIAEQITEKIAHLLTGIPASVQVGMQSADRQVLKRLHRPYDPERFAHGIHLLNQAGVPFGLDLIYGLPGDNLAGFNKSLNTAIGFQPNHLDLFPLAVLEGTRIAERVEEFDIRVNPEAGQQVVSHRSYSEEEMQLSHRLAESANLLYNRAKAVGYLLRFCNGLQITPAALFDLFTDWRTERNIAEDDSRSDKEIYLLCRDFYTDIFQQKGSMKLLKLALDCLQYHFYYAETLMGEAIVPRLDDLSDRELLNRPWLLAENVHLVDFNFEIIDILSAEELPLKHFIKEFRPSGSVALFFRTEGEMFCESVEEDFIQLLRRSNGERRVAEILPGLHPEEQAELLRFAVGEGILVATEG